MENQNHCISIKQAELTSIILRNSFLNNGYVYVKQHENDNLKKSVRERERENTLTPLTVQLSWSFHGKTIGLGNEVLDSFKY